ncbi:hypothetical protein GCM10025870_01840 [Agromyces marinus]|uniref:UmuC domain-containing protein n=1 Tax=Agromyces marinus TaxID=1389020 RepID=A0ABN6Y7F0_9MICO|nr:DNA polymerase Y family protein [Agromyces marinus]BDZ53111.1 hypothetical protein GCM10025870_01840 [Agromyces marinus]
MLGGGSARRGRTRAEAARGAVPLPALEVLPYDAALDHRAFEPVVRGIEAIVPGVQVVRPGTLAMRARGPARYYGDEDAAARALLAAVAEHGIAGACVGVADGPFAAEQAARAAGAHPDSAGRRVLAVPPEGSAGFLAPLPVSLVVDARTTTLLHRLGVRTLGGFAALPEEDVRRRFGAAGAFAHDRAAGRERSRVAPRTPPPDFEVEQHFEPPLERIDQLAFAFRVRAEEFIERMRAKRLVCTGIRVELDDDRGGHSSRSWLHPHWFTPADVVDRVRWQLQGAGPADAGLEAPIVRLRIVPERVDSTGNHEEGLWGGGPDERVHHGLTRVQSMLGHEGVLTAAVGGGRMLADRQVLVPWGDRPPEGAAAEALAGKPARARSGERVPGTARGGVDGCRGRLGRGRCARHDLVAARVVRGRRCGARAGASVGGSVAGRGAVVGSGARPTGAPVPGGRSRGVRVAAGPRCRGLVGRGEVRLMRGANRG